MGSLVSIYHNYFSSLSLDNLNFSNMLALASLKNNKLSHFSHLENVITKSKLSR